jgi:hypothetical protein
MSANYFKPRNWNVICEVCGIKIKSDDSLRRWDNKIVCKNDFETRHPADFLRNKQNTLSVPFTRPEATDSFITVNYFPINGNRAIAGIAVAGLAVTGRG